MDGTTIRTERLVLVAPDGAIERAAAGGPQALARALGARVPRDWPPPMAANVLGYWAVRLEAEPALRGWTARYWLLERDAGEPELVGYGGFKGPPDAEGTVEVGYAVVAGRQRAGLATEAVGALVSWAFARSEVRSVVAHTYPELHASIRVLEKLGFERRGEGAEPRTLCYRLARPELPECRGMNGNPLAG
ncbi:MAG TPA: GNAT family protein [Planctomycetota bacterium]|nr:GNAT family protein [Planctomycetota bacterium]